MEVTLKTPQEYFTWLPMSNITAHSPCYLTHQKGKRASPGHESP